MRFGSSTRHAPLSISARVIIDCCAKFSQWMLPQHCLLCTAATAADPICAACAAELPRLAAMRCAQCALPNATGEVCGACIAHPPAYTTVAAAWAYAWPLSVAIRQFKYAGNLALTHWLAAAIAAMPRSAVDLIVPMPLAPARLRERGFNQALELARCVGAATAIPVDAGAVRRVRDSAPQAMLPWRERAKNIRGAFVFERALPGMRVAVIDDVMTTGATLDEIARTLRKAGAVEVHGWMVARTRRRA
jgi:ComF family protein